MAENNDTRQQRFVGILTSVDVVSFLAKPQCLEDQDKAMKTLVSDVVVPDNALLKIVDPGIRLAHCPFYVYLIYLLKRV